MLGKVIFRTLSRLSIVSGWTQQWLMNVGDRKGLILDEAIRTRQPKTVLELGIVSSLFLSSSGTFLGYSSLRMAAQPP